MGRRQVFDDVRDVGGVELREALVRDLQLHAPRWIGFEQIDVLPRDHARRHAIEKRPQGEARDDAFRQPPDGAARANVDGDDVERDVAVDRRRIDLHVVDAHDLAAVDVDDLLVEEVALEQEEAVGRAVALPVGDIAGGAHAGAGGLDGGRWQHTFARRGADDQVGNACGMFLRGDGDFAHTSPYGAGGIAHGGAEQLGQGDERHAPGSPGKAMAVTRLL